MIILLTLMTEFITQNAVDVLCPLVHQSRNIKGLQVCLFTQVNFDFALIAG